MKLNIQQTLEFFDNPRERGHASAIVGLMGEDLNAAAFKHYMEMQLSAKVAILPDPVTTGKQKGKRLDRWIYVKVKAKETLYQCEMKSWSATALGGRYLTVDADNAEIREAAQYHWTNQLLSPVTSKPASRGRIKTGHSEMVY